MIRIAICDDEKHFVNKLSEILVTYGETIEEIIVINEFYDGRMLVEKYDCKYDIIFLDIKMPYIDGVKVAEQIRLKDPNVTIIFLTSLMGRAVDGYKVQASNFLIKPVSKSKVTREIDQWLDKNRQMKQDAILVENANGQFRIPISSLRYVETFNRNLLLHTESKNVVSYKKLKDVKEQLKDSGFAQSHKGYLINLSYVDTISGNDVHLVTKEIIPLSRVWKKEFMSQLARYLGGNA